MTPFSPFTGPGLVAKGEGGKLFGVDFRDRGANYAIAWNAMVVGERAKRR